MAHPSHQPSSGRPHLRLLETFDLSRGSEPANLPQSAQRVVALLALKRTRVSRSAAASTLWGDAVETSGTAVLRSALYRLRRAAAWSVIGGDGWLQLNPMVSVDVDERRRVVTALRAGDVEVGDDAVTDLALDAPLLSGWRDDWLEPYRRRELELERHARDALAEQLVAAGRSADAIDLALISIARDPLWEWPYRLIAGAHLGAGNPAEAMVVFEEYRCLVSAELGTAPSTQFYDLLGAVTHVPDTA